MTLEVGKKFSSYEEVFEYVASYEQAHFVRFWKRDARLITAARSNSFIRPQLKYCELKYTCIFGGKKFKSTGKNIREVRTFKKENPCQAFISLRHTPDGRFLQIVRFSEEHNHDISVESFSTLPQQRKTQERVNNLVALRKNSQVAWLKLRDESEEHLSLRDLPLPLEKGGKCLENLERCISILTGRYQCDISLLKDETNTFRGLFVQNLTMKKTAEAFPEFLGIDATYRLINIGIPVFMFTTEDGNCQTEIIAICLLVSEDRESINWLIDTFKEKNSKWKSIKSIIMDKDFSEKQLVVESFPEAIVSTCIFHCMKTFTRELKNDMYGINDEKRDQILSMAEASSETAFEALYDDLKASTPQNFLIYFYKNWYHLRSQWSMCQGCFKYNFVNSTDTRIDAVNAKLKKITNRKSRFEHFLDTLISTLHSLDCKKDYKCFSRQQKRLVTKYDSTSPETKYMDLLTCEAAKLIVHQLELSRSIKSNQFVKKEESFIFKEASDVVAKATVDRCDCSFSSAMVLPCQHMFLIRRIFDLPLFVPDLIPERWTIKQMILQECINQEILTESDVKPKEQSKLSFGEKRRKVLVHMNELATTAAQADDVIFEERLQDIKDLLTFWKNGFRTQVAMVNDDGQNFQASDIKEENYLLDNDYNEDVNEENKDEEVYYVVMEKESRNEASKTPGKNDSASTKKRGRPPKSTCSVTESVKKSKQAIQHF